MKIQDRAKQETIKFEPWPRLIELADLFVTCLLLVCLKSRQVGFTWLVCIYAIWKAKFHENVKVLMLSKGEDEAYDLISKCRFVDNHLPDFIRSKRDPDQRGFICFPDTNSEIKALPSTQDAGRSTDATVVFCDEWEFHPYAEQNYAALKPTIDAGGQFIGASTADKTKMETFFKKKYMEAKSGTGNFIAKFIGWDARPDRDSAWFDRITQDMSPSQREQEYPSNEDEALAPLKARRFFDQERLKAMETKPPIDNEISKKWGCVKVYKLPIVGRRYAVFTDPSDGKEDPHATVVRDSVTGEWVAISHGMLTADQCAMIHDELSRFYHNAFNSYELNSRAGGIFSEKIKELATPNQCPFVDTNGLLTHKGKYGWWTGNNLKNKMLYSLEENIRLGIDTVYDKDAIDELKVFFVPQGEEPQAPRGGHDDIIMSGGGVIQISKYIRHGEVRVSSFKYAEA